jgi:hypothetical protein
MTMLRRTLSLQFIQKHKMGRSSCDAVGLAFAVYVQLQLTVCSKHISGEIQL